jgi:predicted nucleic-acid-binding Zn-ribbon protein
LKYPHCNNYEYAGDNVIDPPQVTMRYFDDWKYFDLTCAICKWKGKTDPEALKCNDSDHYLVLSFQCPHCGKSLLSIEQSSTMDEALANIDKLTPA